MKVLQATEHFLPGVERGIDRFVYGLSRGLISAGHDVTVFAGGRGKDRTLGGIRIEYASMFGARMTRWASNLYDRRINYVPSGIMKMYRQGPDVVHAHHFGGGYAASVLKKYNGTPYVLTVHKVPTVSSLAIPAQAYRLMFKKGLEGASVIISVSKCIEEQIKKDFGMDSTIIPLSVDTEKFAPCEDKSALKRSMGLPDGAIICMVSAIEGRWKQADALVRAMPHVLKKVAGATLVLAGYKGPGMASYLSDMAEKLGVRGRVIITRWIDDLAARSYLALADAFVVPFVEEADRPVILEAMSSAAPVICPDSGDIAEYIRHGYNGLLFDHDSIEDLADKVALLLLDKSMAAELGRNGRMAAISRYSWGSAVRDYSAIYDNAVKA